MSTTRGNSLTANDAFVRNEANQIPTNTTDENDLKQSVVSNPVGTVKSAVPSRQEIDFQSQSTVASLEKQASSRRDTKVRFNFEDDEVPENAIPRQQQSPTQIKNDNNKTGEEKHHNDNHHDSPPQRNNNNNMSWKQYLASVTFYASPVQRQRWGDLQLKPHTNWGDIFFDLFYVAAAYNLGNLIRLNPTWQGLLYFVGCYLPVQLLWFTKLRYDSRYFTHDDIWHQIYEMAVYLLLATVVLHIQPVSILSNPSKYVDMFALSLALVLGEGLGIGRQVEILCGVDGEEAAKVSARIEILHQMIPFSLYLAAAIFAGVEYYSSNHDIVSHSSTDVPIWLCLAGSVISNLWLLFVVLVWLPRGGNHKSMTVPMNIDYSIHRYGEWIMLMLGEGVLSLLIVNISHVSGYFVTFFSGVVSLTLMEYLHFRSQPHHADQHAMRRSKEAGLTFAIVIQIYSAALILVGACYKMLLYDFLYVSTPHQRRRGLLSGFFPIRDLEGNVTLDYDMTDRRQRVANLFGGSLAVSWLCSDIMILAHRGLDVNVHRCQCKATKKIRIVAVFLVMLRLGLIIFIATLSQYETTPEAVALWGMVGILAQVVLRVVGGIVFPDDPSHESSTHGSDMKWPDITEAQSVPAEVHERGH